MEHSVTYEGKNLADEFLTKCTSNFLDWTLVSVQAITQLDTDSGHSLSPFEWGEIMKITEPQLYVDDLLVYILR